MSLPGVALHIVQRGNNRQTVFFERADYRAYLDTLFESSSRYDVSVHAFVCMTNHVHLLVTPWEADSASCMMQRLGSTYTAGINALHRRSGSLWEGRFKSSLVDSEGYVLACYRYIELNPVRAGMTRHPGDYPWSSHGHNAERLSELPIRPHEAWLALGADASARRARYRALVKDGTNPDEAKVIRYAARKGLPTGSSRFKRDIEAALARKIGDGRRGRPRKGL
jgi:putative transposase